MSQVKSDIITNKFKLHGRKPYQQRDSTHSLEVVIEVLIILMIFLNLHILIVISFKIKEWI